MMLHLLRLAFACGLAAVLAAGGTANAQSQHHKKPRPPALAESPYARDPGCVVTYDSSGFAQPPELNPSCETAFRRLYPPR